MDRFRLGTIQPSKLLSSSSVASSSNGSSPSLASDTPNLLIRSDVGRVVSLKTCSKACVICFTVGVFVGFTLKRRLRRWVTKILKRMKDD